MAGNCSISFMVDYTSSKPIKSATFTYTHIATQATKNYHMDPAPSSNDVITLYPEILTLGDYELTVDLETTDGSVVATKKSTFKIGDCKGSETRQIFYNHGTSNEVTTYSEADFKIERNGVLVIPSEPSRIEYNDPLENWKSFTAEVGDTITFTTKLIKSGSSGKTLGDMFIYSTTGASGTVVVNPTAPNLLLLDSQKVGMTEGTIATFTFTVGSGLNYALGTNYYQ
ncbi:hypothetical protein [Chryseobacterium sp. MMS23-Vi53]|uniref:hypothetical protein n=1 Tax=Chryseobacterium sp. MMS23-Vi53 TaxID=3386644 RepID=UPI0039EA08B7